MRIKQSILETRYSNALKIIKLEMYEAYGYLFCQSCKASHRPLSGSHLISRQDIKNYDLLELYYDRENIRLHCMDWGGQKGCHNHWEEGTKLGIDTKANLKYIKKTLNSSVNYKPLLMKYLNRWAKLI